MNEHEKKKAQPEIFVDGDMSYVVSWNDGAPMAIFSSPPGALHAGVP